MQKTALITGASSGLGAETAKYFLSTGYRVFGTSRTLKNNDESGINWLQLDLSELNSIKSCCEQIEKLLPCPLTIIHNAGIGTLGAALDYNADDFEKVFKTNFFGITHFNHLLANSIIKHKVSLIFISSLAGTNGLNYRSAYVASKHALEGYVKSLRMELLQFSVPVSIVAPGDVKTNIADSRTSVNPDAQAPWNKDYQQVVSVIDQEVNKGIHPKKVAKKIFKIAQLEKPAFKYIVAPGIQKFSFYLQGILPYAVFERLLINHYNK